MSLISVTGVFSWILTLSYRRPLMNSSHNVFLSLLIDRFFFHSLYLDTVGPFLCLMPFLQQVTLYYIGKIRSRILAGLMPFLLQLPLFSSQAETQWRLSMYLTLSQIFFMDLHTRVYEKQVYQWLKILLCADPRDQVLLY